MQGLMVAGCTRHSYRTWCGLCEGGLHERVASTMADTTAWVPGRSGPCMPAPEDSRWSRPLDPRQPTYPWPAQPPQSRRSTSFTTCSVPSLTSWQLLHMLRCRPTRGPTRDTRMQGISTTMIEFALIFANPPGTQALELTTEVQTIRTKLRAEQRKSFLKLRLVRDASPSAIEEALKFSPHLVHFGGHGRHSSLGVESDRHRVQWMPKAALSQWITVLSKRTRIVLLNACHSIEEAEPFLSAVECVIGMRAEISDPAALGFASSFYSALGDGKSVAEAFASGKAGLVASGVKEEDIPVLKTRDGVKAEDIRLFRALKTVSVSADSATDRELAIELQKTLVPLSRLGVLDLASINDVPIGATRTSVVENLIQNADILLPLLSRDLTNDPDLLELLEESMRRRPQLLVAPLMLRSCDISATPFAGLQAIPRSGILDGRRAERDEALVKIAQELVSLMARLLADWNQREHERLMRQGVDSPRAPRGALTAPTSGGQQTPPSSPDAPKPSSSGTNVAVPTSETVDNSIDFLIIAPLKEEREALLAHLGNAERMPPDEHDVRIYYRAEVQTKFAGGKTGTYRVIVTSPLGMGRVEASTATADAIRRWQPRYVLLVGIAGGDPDEVELGDVLIAEQLVDYELAKITDDGAKTRYQTFRVDPRLLIASQVLSGWETTVKAERPTLGKPSVHCGIVISGDKVQAASASLEPYKGDWPKLIGVEMEAAGVAAAAWEAVGQPGVLMVRGVSDLADAKKGSARVKKWRPYACDVAAAFAIALLRDGPVPLPVRGNSTHAPIGPSPTTPAQTPGTGDPGTGSAQNLPLKANHETTASQTQASPPSGSMPTKMSLRKVLQSVLRTDSDLDAFCLDHFPKVKRMFSGGMDTEQKRSLLLEKEDPSHIWKQLQRAEPESCAKYTHLIEMEA